MSILRQMWRPFFPQLSISMVMYLLDGKKCKLKHLPVGLLRNPRQIWSLGSMKLCLRPMSGVQTQADWLLVVSGYSSMCVEERVRSWRQNLDPSVRGFGELAHRRDDPGLVCRSREGSGRGHAHHRREPSAARLVTVTGYDSGVRRPRFAMAGKKNGPG